MPEGSESNLYNSLYQVFLRIPTPQVLPKLVEAMQSDREMTRCNAIFYTAIHADLSLVEPLTAILESPRDGGAHYMAFVVLEEIWCDTNDPRPLALIQKYAHAPHDEDTLELIEEIVNRTRQISQSNHP